MTILPKLLTLALFALASHSRAEILKHEKFQDSIEADPKVKSFEVEVLHKVTFFDYMRGVPYYSTSMISKIETHKAQDLKDYVVVQFIRGCLFITKQGSDGEIEFKFPPARKFHDGHSDLKHPEWVIDSNDKDPVYWSDATGEYGRIGAYRMDNPHMKLSKRYFHQDKGGQNFYYVHDLPGGASYSDYLGHHTNTSLEFKTCLYRESEVPLSTSPSPLDIKSTPLKCFSWRSNFEFNYESDKYEMKDGINPVCLL